MTSHFRNARIAVLLACTATKAFAQDAPLKPDLAPHGAPPSVARRAAVYAIWDVAGAAAVAGVAFELAAHNPTPALARRARSYQITADVLFSAAGAGAVAGALLFFLPGAVPGHLALAPQAQGVRVSGAF